MNHCTKYRYLNKQIESLEAPKRRKKKKEPVMDDVLPEFTVQQREAYAKAKTYAEKKMGRATDDREKDGRPKHRFREEDEKVGEV